MVVRGRDIAEMVKRTNHKFKKTNSFNRNLYWSCITILVIFAYIGLFINIMK